MKDYGRRLPGLSRGFFLALEGLDGAGKSTLAALLMERLAGLGLEPVATREPLDDGLRHLSAAGRAALSPQAEAELFVRDRARDVAENILPAVLEGRPVVADRYILSNAAYQSAKGAPAPHVMKMNAPFPWPDLTVVLDVPVGTALARLAGRGAASAFEDPAGLAGARDFYAAFEGPGLLRLDGESPPGDLAEAVMAELRRRGLVRGPLGIIDSHCHLPSDAGRLAGFLARARRAGVAAMLDTATNLAHSRLVVGRAAGLPGVWPVVGYHPQDVKDMGEGEFTALMDLAAQPAVRGFGEIGLDFCVMTSPRQRQLAAFEQLLEGATSLGVPVVIHSRDAFAETLALLEKYAPRLKRPPVIHCFTLGPGEAQAYLGLGCYLSIPGVVTYPKSDALRQAVALAPADRLLVETDSPYMAPAPFRGRDNEPSYLAHTLQAIAGARGLTLGEAASLTAANARRAFNL